MSTSSSSSSSPSSIWVLSYIKFNFFSRIRRFLQSKSTRKRHAVSSDRVEAKLNTSENVKEEQEEEESVKGSMEDKSCEEETVVLQRSVKKLHFGNWEEKEMAAKEIGWLGKEDVKIRKVITELGVVPVLVSMVDSKVTARCRAAIRALIELANGTYTNKALVLEAGILSKLPKRMEHFDELARKDFAELVLSLSSLANTKFPLASSELFPFLIGILESSSSLETKEGCLGALYNFSTVIDNAGGLISNGVVDILLKLSSMKETSEKALASLGNLVVTLMGKKAMEDSPMVPEGLIEILTWEDKPKCQELSSYILMILAHQSSEQREKMAKSGIVGVLLKVALLGSPLTQKRALKLLQWFKDERQAKVGPHSGPQTARIAMGSPANTRETQEGKKMMKNLVKESLHRNMEIITRRANAFGESSNLKSLIISTSSKSLPY